MGLYAEGSTVTEIARRCSVAKSTVSTTLKKAREGKAPANKLWLVAPIALATSPVPWVTV